jgi:DNA-binding response OmpR family regulator
MLKKRILIADDEMEVNETLTLIATRHGYEVVSVTDGVDLMAIVVNERFDLIITDLIMPHLNGASASEILKMQGHTIPIIALTALSRQDIARVVDKFVRIFYKPCNVEELFKYIDSLIC